MKKMKKGMLYLLCGIFLWRICLNGYAMEDITLPFSENGTVTVHFSANTPEGFQKDLEIYLSGSAYYMTFQSGYDTKIQLEPGKYDIKILCYGDMTDRYTFDTIDSFHTDHTKDICIMVRDRLEGEEGEKYENGLKDHGDWQELQEEIYDFSDGKPYGTIFLYSKPYGAVTEATYVLVGEEGLYEISLKNDYAGCAKIHLPVGAYYESGSMEVNLKGNAVAPYGMTFGWQHKDNPGVWGNYYNVQEGQTLTIDDLIIMMAVDGHIAELNSNALFSKNLIETRESLMESHYQEALESAFPENYEERETIAVAEAVDVSDVHVYFVPIICMIVTVILLISVIGTVIWCRRTKC